MPATRPSRQRGTLRLTTRMRGAASRRSAPRPWSSGGERSPVCCSSAWSSCAPRSSDRRAGSRARTRCVRACACGRFPVVVVYGRHLTDAGALPRASTRPGGVSVSPRRASRTALMRTTEPRVSEPRRTRRAHRPARPPRTLARRLRPWPRIAVVSSSLARRVHGTRTEKGWKHPPRHRSRLPVLCWTSQFPERSQFGRSRPRVELQLTLARDTRLRGEHLDRSPCPRTRIPGSPAGRCSRGPCRRRTP